MHSDLFNFLPDISGVFLAAVGVAIVVHPHPMEKLKDRRSTTRFVAALLLVIGSAGLYSSYVQRRDSRLQQEQAQRDRQRYDSKIDQLGLDVHQILAESDRKYDALIASTPQGSRREEAESAKGWFDKALIHLFDVRLPAAKADAAKPCEPNATRPFQCMSNSELGQLLLTEAEKLQSMALAYERSAPTMSMRVELSTKIDSCCLRDIGDMRSTVFDRLGPSAQSQAEQTAWQDMVLYKTNSTKTLSPEQVRDYAHNLELWGQTLEKTPSGR